MRLLLINLPTKGHPIVRDMAGGVGFDGGQQLLLPPLDLAYMGAILLAKGHTVKIIDSDAQGYGVDRVCQDMKAFCPDASILSVSLPNLYQDCLMIKEMRGSTRGRIFVKTTISFLPLLKEICQRSGADVCIYGESDIAIEEIIQGKEKRGTAYFEDGEFRVEENLIVENLDTLPLPARSLLPNDSYRYILLGDKVTTMQTSRGCPYPCSYYCPYPLVQGRSWRARSPEHVVREIEDIVCNYGIDKILFRDATFTLDKERVKNICALLREKKISIRWWCETRVDCLDYEIMRRMKEAGCQGMNIGVETGDLELMQTQAKIGLTLKKLNVVITNARELGMGLHLLLMIGLPQETRKSLYRTYQLIRTVRPQSIGVCIVTPYPGTVLYEQAKQKGWIESEDWARFGGHYPVMHTDNLSTKDLWQVHQMIVQAFALSKKGLMGRLKLLALDHRFRKWARV